MKMHREPAREIPVARETDVIVVGGGPAGLAAAIASARGGAKTVLVEQFGYLGGTATASLMACINGFRNQVEPDATQTVRGIAEEIVLSLKEIDGLGQSPYQQKAYPTDARAAGVQLCHRHREVQVRHSEDVCRGRRGPHVPHLLLR